MPKPKSPSSNSPITWDERLIQRLIPWRVELAGLGLFVIASLTFLDLLGLNRSLLPDWWIDGWRMLLGWGAAVATLLLAGAGLHLALRRTGRSYRINPAQVIGLELLLLTALPLIHLVSGATRAEAYDGYGGLIGWALSEPLLDFFGPVLAGLLYLALLLLGAALAFRVTWDDMLRGLESASRQLREGAARLEAERRPATGDRRPAIQNPQAEIPNPNPRELIIIDDSAPGAGRRKVRRRDPQLPGIDLLEEGVVLALSKEEIDEKKRTIEETLGHFGIPATVTEVRRGPAVTQFGVLPGYVETVGADGEPRLKKVRVSQIAALQKDLTLALAAPRLRIEAPVPGRGVVGVEVPNAEVNIVRLRSVIQSEQYQKLKAPLKVGLGRDVAGAPVAIDLAKLPHLLIAGSTGAGKSVCINALVTCLAFNNTPDQLRMVMIDPKKVELIRFNGLPHLQGNVEVDGERIVGLLRWLTQEMDRRYQSFAEVGAKHLADYNRKIDRYKDTEPLPYLCVFIDELADLMMNYPAETEGALCRLAQMARATGIHLVVATQRPSTDVITGLIKANFPARIAFAVTSGIDSRVILDTVGAEQLMGRGDMLFLSPEASAPVRLQGIFISDNEMEAVVAHWQKAMPREEQGEAPWEKLIAKRALLDETDDLLERAIELAKKYDSISTSLIQRRLRLGYPRAARLMEHLYEMGLVADPKQGGKTRQSLVDEDDTPLDDYLAEQRS